MDIIKIKISDTEKMPDNEMADFLALGLHSRTNQNVHTAMEQLRGNTAYAEWAKKNPGKTYEDWIKLLQEPALEAAGKADTATQNANKATSDANAAETLRANAENARVTAETNRVNVEKTRVTAESGRATAETARVDAEGKRVTAETARVDAEGKRVTAENARVTAENKRQTDTTTIINNAKTATSNAQNAADRSNALSDHRDEIRDGYWWRWNETSEEWYNTGEIAKGNVMYATFDIDLTTGELSMYTDEEYTGANFALENGMLTVEI